jgi:AraC-like DNA-binding protein
MDKKNNNYEVFIADLPPERTRVFYSPEELEAALAAGGVLRPTRQLSDGEFRAHIAVAETDCAALFSGRCSTAIAVYLEPPVGMVSFLFPRSASGIFFANGVDIGNDRLLAFPVRTGIDIAGSGPIGADSIGIDENRFWAIADAVCPGLKRHEQAAIIPGDPEALHALRDRLTELIAAPEPGPSSEDVSHLIGDIIGWIADHQDAWLTESAVTTEARVCVAKRAQDYIEAHYREAVHIEDLCRVTCVGARTLQRCFREYFHMTVSKYLKVVRLDSARRELAAADRASTSVTAIAMHNGCNHLGRFSVDYRQHFGQSPRETLTMHTLRL